MKRTFNRTFQQEVALIKGGNKEALTKAIKSYAFTPKAQCLLLEAGKEAIRDLYLELRRPCAQFVAKVLEEHSDDKGLIKKACIGCGLSKENEAKFVRIFKDDMATLEEYLRECPDGPTFLDSTFESADEDLVQVLIAVDNNRWRHSQEVKPTTLADLLKQ